MLAKSSRCDRALRTMRWMCAVTLKDKQSSVHIIKRLRTSSTEKEVRKRRLKWFEHVARKTEDESVKKVTSLVVEGKTPQQA